MVEKFPKWDNLYNKPDMERLGLFSEMPYMQGKYVSLFPKPKVTKGRNIMGEGRKSKCGTQAGYFDNEFRRLFIGEALKGRGRKPKPPRFKPVSKQPFMPPTKPKLHSTPGDYYGTFSGNIEAFSNKRRKAPEAKKEPKNFLTNPGKKGGYGYLNICLNKYPTHTVDRYGESKKYKEYGIILNGPMVTAHFPKPYFEPNPFPDPPKMKPGPTYVKPQEKEYVFIEPGFVLPPGMHKLPGAECFEPFPEYKTNKYITAYDLIKPRKHQGGEFFPQSTAEKSFYTTSAINGNLKFRINSKNYSTYEPTYTKHLLK